MEKRKITVNMSNESYAKLLEEYSNLNGLSYAYHLIKYLRKNDLIIVDKKFKKKVVKITASSLASISLIAFMFYYFSKRENNIEDNNTNYNVEETENNNIQSNDVQVPSAILSKESFEGINNNKNNISNYEIDNEEIKEMVDPEITLYFPKANDTNENSDKENYYYVKEKYGLYIDKISKESGIDSRILIAIIAQENAHNQNKEKYGSYGITCITSIHNGVTYDYYHYNNNGEYVNDKVTINTNNLKRDNENFTKIYQNKEYGDITVAEAYGIYYTAVILKDFYSHVNNNNLSTTPEENILLGIAAYNHGYVDVNECTKNYDNIYDKCYSIRYNNANKSANDDDQYIEHILNKIPDEELNTPFSFIDNKGNIITFNMARSNEIAAPSSSNDKKHIL